MYLKTIYFYFVISIFIKYVIVEVVGIAGKDLRHTNSNLDHPQPKTPARNNVRRDLEEFFSQFSRELREQDPNQRPYFFQNTPPIVNILPNDIFLNVIYYGTEYDTLNKIPVYSAYRLYFNFRRTSGRIASWVAYPGLPEELQPIIQTGLRDESLHRGHLYPQFYAAGEKMKQYTNFLTNTALQYAAFNMNTWKRLEYALYKASMTTCRSTAGAEVFFLTGVLPSNDNYFPRSNINIPKHFWTAVCCDTSHAHTVTERGNGWSFAYIVENLPERSLNVNMFFVEDFVQRLHGRFMQFFKPIGHVTECLFNADKAMDVIENIREWNANRDRFYFYDKLWTQLYNRYTNNHANDLN